MFKLAKKFIPGIKTVMGGAVFAQLLTPGSPNFQAFLEGTADCIDHLIVGEGENLFLDLLEGKLDSKESFPWKISITGYWIWTGPYSRISVISNWGFTPIWPPTHPGVAPTNVNSALKPFIGENTGRKPPPKSWRS